MSQAFAGASPGSQKYPRNRSVTTFNEGEGSAGRQMSIMESPSGLASGGRDRRCGRNWLSKGRYR